MQLPARIGKYELIEHLGGGMSEVYRSRDTVLGRTVVVKILTREASSDPESRARFLREAQVAANIHHENIVQVHDYGEEQGRPFIVMEYLVGRDLRGVIRDGAMGALIDKMRVALDIARALGYIHSLDITHRDVKPENVHIDQYGRVRLMDFGIAKPAGLSLTRTGIAMGTPFYMAPEQVKGGAVTHSVDIYAFGVMLFEMLTGSRAFQAETVEQLFFQILQQPIDVSRLKSAGVPPKLQDLILRCTRKEASERPATFADVTRSLDELILAEQASATRVLPATAPAQKPKVWIAVAAAVVIIAGAVTAWLMLKGPRQIPGMVFIAEGTFLHGPEKKPVKLHAFYIDETEVSNREYGSSRGEPDLPVTAITIAEARKFCVSKGRRLPTALEWERAARGTNGNLYPWGDKADAALANVSDHPSPLKRPATVRSYAKYGVWNMGGNVWEMNEGKVTPSENALSFFAGVLNPPPTAAEPWIWVRGGSFNTPVTSTLTWEYMPIPERYSASDIGFRCAKDAN